MANTEKETPKLTPTAVENVAAEEEIFHEGFIDTTPSNWIIKASEEDNEYIEARNGLTGEVFEGTIADFNIALRG